jgi:thioredoxin 1
MIERAWISLLAVSLLLAGYYLFKKLQLRAVNKSARNDSRLSDAPDILYFWSPTCSVCLNAQKPALEQLSERIGTERLQITSVDVTEQPELASRYRVLTVPTTLILDQSGQVKYMNNGIVGLGKLLQQMEVLGKHSLNSA